MPIPGRLHRLVPVVVPLLVGAPARAQPREPLPKNAVHADLGLAVVGVGLERTLAPHLALEGQAHVFGTWWDDPHFRGLGGQVRASLFPWGRAPEGLYVAPFFRLERVTAEATGDAAGLGWSAGTFFGASFVAWERLNVRVGAGLQYMRYVTEKGAVRVSWEKPYPALDLLVGVLF